jgi:carbonic anhydrase
MDNLISGYRRFRANGWPARRSMMESLARGGQRPNALVVACIDSRVDPVMVFDARPGELLTVRNVANLVPPYAPSGSYHGTSAALEFGVRELEVGHLVVLGHGLCGGVQALLNSSKDGTAATAGDFIAPWMSIAEPARLRSMSRTTDEDRQRCCEHEVIKVSLANLRTFPWIAEREARGALKLHGAWFNIFTGELMVLQTDGTFAAVT